MCRAPILVRSADAVIAVGCSWGTLLEIALAVKLARPVVVLHGWRISDERGNAVDDDVLHVRSPEKAVRLATTMALDRQ